MKSEDELLIELRDGLAAYAASSMTMQRVEAREFPLVDQGFYDAVTVQMARCGLLAAGDFVPITGTATDGTMRCFIRAFLSGDGSYTAACYHPRPPFWLGLVARVLSGRLGKVVEVESEFSDDSWLITTTVPKGRLFDPPPLILREHHPENTGVEELLAIHKARLAAYQKANPSVSTRRVRDVAGLERSQSRQHDITAAYRAMVGGLTADEIRRFSVFGRARSAELKARLDASREPTCASTVGTSSSGAQSG